MQKIKTATHVLAMVFLGLLVGGAIAGNKAAWICGLIFLILDVICGIAIQYFCDKQPKRTTWDSLTAEEKSLFQQEPNAKLIRELERRGIDIQRVIADYENNYIKD